MIYFIEAARQLMSSDGIQALSIRGIAEIAGYNSATLYNYFETKEDIIARTIVYSIDTQLTELRR